MEGGRSQIIEGLESHGQEFGFYLECERKPIKGCDLGEGHNLMDVIKRSLWLPCGEWTMRAQASEDGDHGLGVTGLCVCLRACVCVCVCVCVSIPVKAEGWVLVVAMEMMDSGDIQEVTSVGPHEGLEGVQREKKAPKGAPQFLAIGIHCHLNLPCHLNQDRIFRSSFSVISVCS